ncbi:MAG: hypothetical protein GWO20_04995 [Candidatus Korarchaeota archaeon]|nr:hypothetical protein [Candidatus Korarchaeota archaeon]NIU82794.1 hypothetical protein [Candidatus Thorarchaeota archaeon]NIW13287.1 hypothetical protein [Candidatus Thorarchaeota archaeon]NIW52143.1 hypothetical protein [Candidatus Korarchaeota archaeon]
MKYPKECLKLIVRRAVEQFDEDWARVPLKNRLDIIAGLIDGTSQLSHSGFKLSRELEHLRDQIVMKFLWEKYGER